ncbi:nucleoside triphosphate pyrophosphohydrolase [Marivibrio halodurans]|uniref:Nucleoside triphosphate pyrophosphohydrolase n=1 Tax=Marivibrio halodurans TaxID=2039722 RepID=A0A8J7RW23_9PROT|nr:nucleoside triphosphate pyrophosphohydrolase [Marivibrio halodurans]MBP5855590.1 nucleoside triphosphate pyrophosphohydrolase [Marivibrio halodurans]
MAKTPPSPADRGIDRLIAVMAALRDPDGGCPWDLKQDFASIAPYTIEEAYEVADAIRHGDRAELRDELGDLLLQVVFHSRMAEEEQSFDFEAVAQAIAEKMIRRHPHVFANDTAETPDAVKRSWEETKASERNAKGQDDSALSGVALALPALQRAEKLSKRAARVGFTWPDAATVFGDIEEELDELKAEIEAGTPHDRLEDELGDVLFTIANLARLLGVDPEAALRRTNDKFTDRFQMMERSFKDEGRALTDCSLDEMDARWDAVKARGKG